MVVRLRCLAALVLLVLLGCGEGAAAPAPKGPPFDVAYAPKVVRPDARADGAAASQPSAATAPASAAAASALPSEAQPPTPALSALPATVGHLESPDRLGHLFEALAALPLPLPLPLPLQDGRARGLPGPPGRPAERDVRILQYGDSHTASDTGVKVFRRALQSRFGDGGRGFVSIGKPWKTYWQDGVRVGMSKEFEPSHVTFHKGSYVGVDGAYGLLGVGIESSQSTARAWTDVDVPTSHVEVDYWQQPHGGSFDLFVDGARVGRITTRDAQTGAGYFGFDLEETRHHVEVSAVGDGQVRIFGMALDRARAGVVVDTLGINGAQVFTPLRWNEAHFAEQLRHRAPDLVILAYGTNEALNPELTDADYEHGLVELLGRVARAAPSASCLLLGPPDLARRVSAHGEWRTLPRIEEIIAIQRRVARAAGCAFFDQMAAMGGPGTIAQWALEHEPRAGADRVHMRQAGYTQLATAFAGDLTRAYDEWRAARGLSPSPSPARAPRTWGGAIR